MFRKLAVWSYNGSVAGLVKPNISDDSKVAYVAGSSLASLVMAAIYSYLLYGHFKARS